MTDPVLDLPLAEPVAGATTVREYLHRLLTTLWHEGEAFNGKRPFGDSGWDYDLMVPLVKAGLVDGELDPDGYVESLDDEEASDQIVDAIARLCGIDKPPHPGLVDD